MLPSEQSVNKGETKTLVLIVFFRMLLGIQFVFSLVSNMSTYCFWRRCFDVSSDYFRLKLCPTYGCYPRRPIFFKNLFYQNNCKEAVNIRGDQIRGVLLNFFVEKSVLFVSSGRCPQFLEKPLIRLLFSINMIHSCNRFFKRLNITYK